MLTGLLKVTDIDNELPINMLLPLITNWSVKESGSRDNLGNPVNSFAISLLNLRQLPKRY
jgi:hypothetical protein